MLQDGLSKNFAQVSVQVVACPDLKQSPWSLASSGLSGKDMKDMSVSKIENILLWQPIKG